MSDQETLDYTKLKVNDLRKLLKNRGLSMAGNKQELVGRLSTSETTAEDLLEGSEVGDELEDEDLERELDENALIGDDTIIENEEKTESPVDDEEKTKTPVEEPKTKEIKVAEVKSASPLPQVTEVSEAKPATPKPSPIKAAPVKATSVSVEEKPTNGTVAEETEAPNTTQQKRKICLLPESSAATEAAKKKQRAERFGAGEEPVKKDVLRKRAERFTTTINSTTTSTTASSDKIKVVPAEALKKRAERFGILSPAEVKKQHLEKLQARKLRFGSNNNVVKESSGTPATTISTTPSPALPPGLKPSQLSIEERKKLRAQRFKSN